MVYFVAVGAALLVCASICQSDVPQAPAPRAIGFLGSFEGRVVSVGPEDVTLRGFALEVSGVLEEDRDDSHRRRVSIITGIRPFVTGTCGSFAATKVVWTRGESAEITLTDGRTVWLRSADQPPRTFRFNDQLRAGGYSEDHSTGDSYRIQDLEVGDDVSLLFQRDGELPRLCEAIRIIRRPGGRIPRANAQRESSPYQYHHHMQAQQDWEEWGIPPSLQYRWARFE